MARLDLVAILALATSACSPAKEKPATTETTESKESTETAEPAKASPYKPVRRVLSAEQQKHIFESPVQTLSGEDTTLAAYRGRALMIVNVASECGLTPQYEQLQGLQARFESQGFSVLAFPCNQFGGQEPGTSDEILAFGKENYSVTFPMMQKLDTNGDHRHPVYQALTAIADHENEAGDVKWNFEKFLLSSDGSHATRIRPEISPDDPAVLELLESELPK